MWLSHLAPAVRDQERSRRFYERYLRFGAKPSRRYPDGVLMLFDHDDFALALGPAEQIPDLPSFFHFGFTAESRAEVLDLRAQLIAEGVEIVEEWDEPSYVSVKCRDPDGYVVEVFWEPGLASARHADQDNSSTSTSSAR